MRKHLKKMLPSLKLISFCLMTNHIHLLLEAAVQVVSDFMKGLHQEYVQGFNLARGRAGPLFKERFWSRPVHSIDDLLRTIRYIDHNPVQAGLVDSIGCYAWGSAGDYIQDWNSLPLARDVVEELLQPSIGRGESLPGAYTVAFGTQMSSRDFEDLTVRHRRESARAKRDLERQDYCSPEYHEEMESFAQFADGMEVLSRRVVPPSEIQDRLTRSPGIGELEQICVSRRDPAATGAQILEIALLKEACCLTFDEIGERLGLSGSVACRRLGIHRSWLEKDGSYAELSERVLAGVLNPR